MPDSDAEITRDGQKDISAGIEVTIGWYRIHISEIGGELCMDRWCSNNHSIIPFPSPRVIETAKRTAEKELQKNKAMSRVNQGVLIPEEG